MPMSNCNRINTDVTPRVLSCLFPNTALTANASSSAPYPPALEERTRAEFHQDEADREQNLNPVSGEHLRGDTNQTVLPVCQG